MYTIHIALVRPNNLAKAILHDGLDRAEKRQQNTFIVKWLGCNIFIHIFATIACLIGYNTQFSFADLRTYKITPVVCGGESERKE